MTDAEIDDQLANGTWVVDDLAAQAKEANKLRELVDAGAECIRARIDLDLCLGRQESPFHASNDYHAALKAYSKLKDAQ